MLKIRITLLIFLFSFCYGLQADTISPRLPPRSMVYFEGRYSNKQKWTAEVDVFLPIIQNERTILFSDLRMIDSKGAAIEGNFGLGLRHMDSRHYWMWGIYGFYDRKRSSLRNFFNQISLGIEFSSPLWWVTITGYLPFGKNPKREETDNEVSLITSQQ